MIKKRPKNKYISNSDFPNEETHQPRPLLLNYNKDVNNNNLDVFSILLKDRILFLADEVENVMATQMVATLLLLDHQDPTKEISIYINTPGGTITDGLFAIYDTMQYIRAPIRTVCIGEAYSSGAIILAAGTPGRRMAFKNSHIMIHDVQISQIVEGTGASVQIEAKEARKLSMRLFEIIAKHTGQSLDKVMNDCQSDFYLTPEDAIKYGIIDEIVKPSKKIPRLRRVTKKTKSKTTTRAKRAVSNRKPRKRK